MLGDIRDDQCTHYAQLELAWAAGFFDGEGCTYFSTHKRPRGRPRLSICMSVGQHEPTTLVRFQYSVGGGNVGGPWAAGNKSMKNPLPRYRWSCRNTKDSIQVLRRLWPYLSREKKIQAHRALANYKEAIRARGH